MPIDLTPAINIGNKNIAEQLQELTQKLQIIATNFLDALKPYEQIFYDLSLSQQHYALYNKQLKSKGIAPQQVLEATAALNSLRQEINNLAKQKTLFTEISRLSDEFRADLLELLGKQLVVVMVAPNGKEYIVNKENADKVVRYERRQGQVIERFKYLNKQMQTMADQSWPRLQEMIRLNALEPDQQLAFTKAAGNTYSIAQYRYQRTERNPHYNKRGIVLAPGKKYIFFTVNTKGDLAEGYVGLLYASTTTEKQLFLDLVDIEEQLYYYLQKHVSQVDNAPGLLVGDLTIGDYEIQVKSAQASSVYFYQARQLADQIVREHWTIEDFKDYLERSKDEGSKRNCEQEMEKEAMDWLQEQFKRYRR